MIIGLSLTVFEIWAFEIWSQIRAQRESPSGITKHYIRVPFRHIILIRVYGRRWVKSPSYVTALKLWSSITRDRSIVETRSLWQNSMQSTRESFGNVRFIVWREIIFAKVKNRHFRRTECLDSVALDIWIFRRDLHRSANDFATSFVKSTSFESKVIATWKFSTSSAERIRIALELTLLIADERCARRYQETGFLSSVATPTGW